MASSSSSSSSSYSEGIDLFISSLSTMAQENATQISRPIIRIIQINRDREARHDLLMRHYFGNEPLYNETLFKRRFRMQRPLSKATKVRSNKKCILPKKAKKDF
ncbi:hypothetical protein R6Q57_011803 [Mikania cordata]